MTTTQLPPSPTQPPAAKQNGAALASLILGIVSLVANLLLIPTILGLVFGFIGLSRAKALGRKGMAITGVALSVVGAIVGITVFAAIMGGIGKAAEEAVNTLPTSVAVDTDDEAAGDDAASDDSATTDDSADDAAAADIPEGYKAVSDDLWFKWGKTTHDSFSSTKTATVITPNGCNSLLVEANEYDKDGVNVGSTLASASNLGAGDKAKLEFTWLDDDGAVSLKVNDVTCF